MKKLLLFAFVACVSASAYAQKPVSGDRTAEVNLNFQTGSSPINYTLPAELRFRYFLSDNTAFRLRLGMNSNSNKYSVLNTLGDVTSEVVNKTGFGLSIFPGYEKHFAGTAKLSPFIGAQLGISLNGGNSREVSNSGYANPSTNLVINGDSYKSKSGSTLGLSLGCYMGADYYFAEHLYIGGEFGLGLFSMSSTGEGSEKYVRLGAPEVNNKTTKTSSSSLFGVYTGGVRLGFVF